MGETKEKVRTAFECAAAYALCRDRENGKGLSGWLLVMDLDAFKAGLCACDAAGYITLIGDVHVDALPPVSFLDALEQLAGADARAQFTGQEKRVREVYRYYLSGKRRTDLQAYDGVTCSQLEQAFSQTGATLEQLFCSAKGLCDQKLEDESGLRILLIGAMARNGLAEYRAHKFFSVTPILDNDLFWERDEEDDPALFAQKGQELYDAGIVRESRPVGCHVVLVLLDRENSHTAIDLVRPDQSLAELETPAYTPPFLCCCGEPICLIVNESSREIPVSEAFFPAGIKAGMLCAAVVLRGEELCLSVRGADAPGQEIYIPITTS